MVDDGQAKRIILVSVAGTGVLTAVAFVHRESELPPTRVVAGVFITGVLLTTVAEFQPKIAAGLAALMLTTAAFALGKDSWAGVSTIVKPSPVRK